MNINLSVGDLVRLSPDTNMDTSQSYNPLGVVGVVKRADSSGVFVTWSNSLDQGLEVFYDPYDSDLILVHEYLYNTRKEARDQATELGFVVIDLGKDCRFRWGITVKEI